MFKTKSQALRTDERGAALVEFAIAVPILVMLVIGLIQFGLGIYAQSQVTSAAQSGVRYALVKGFDSQAIGAAVTSSAPNLSLAASPAPTQICGCVVNNAVVSVSCSPSTTCAGGGTPRNYVNVTAAATYTPTIRLPGFASTYQLTATAQGRLD